MTVLLLTSSGCTSMWSGGQIHHRQDSGFQTLGYSVEDWKADWRLLSSRHGYDGKRIMKALHDRGATCGRSKMFRRGDDTSAYKCGYVFCRGRYYQSVFWLFPQGTVAPDTVEPAYANMNLQPDSACQKSGNGARMLGLQKFHVCSSTEGEDCLGYVAREACKDGWCTPIITEEPLSSASLASDHRVRRD